MRLPPPAFAAIALICAASAPAANDDAPEAVVTKIGEHRYALGELRFDAKTREIEIPVTVNMREGGPMEYLLVHEHGKVHESVFVTTASPLHVQIAMKLLRYQEGLGDLFNRLLTPEALAREGGDVVDRGDEVVFRFIERAAGADVEEERDGVRLEEMILDAETERAMAEEPWVFTGSTNEGGTFMAEAEGSIIAVYLDPLAIFNTPREGADIDRRWWGRPDAIPEIGAKGVVVIAPADAPDTAD